MNRTAWIRRLSWSIVALAVGLMALGWLGIARSEQLAGGSGRHLMRQIIWTHMCLAAMLAVTLPSYRMLRAGVTRSSPARCCCWCRSTGFRRSTQRRRWIRFGPVGLQPSEFAKLAFVLGLAHYLMYRDSYRRVSGLMVPLAIAMVPLLLVLKEPDLGTALVFLPVLFAMLLAAGAHRRTWPW